MISPDDMSLLLLTDSVEETVADVVSFYRVFHSMVYVPDRLMLRLRKAPSEKQLATINREFADILTDGQFALPRRAARRAERPRVRHPRADAVPLQPPQPRPAAEAGRLAQRRSALAGIVFWPRQRKAAGGISS